MASSLMDLARPTQVNKSLAQQSALQVTPSAKPKARFDDVLAQHRPAEPKEPKAQRPEPSAKSDKPKKADGAKSKKDKQPVGEAQSAEEPTDNTDDLAQAEEAVADEAEASRPADKPEKPKPSKNPAKADAPTDADADEVSADASVEDTETLVNPVPALPTAEVPEESDESTNDEKQPAEAKADPETTTVDPNLLSAQLQPAQQQPTDDQPVQVDGSTEADATAAVTNVTPAVTEAQSKAAKAKPAESTDAEPELVVKPHAQKGHHASDEEMLANADDAAGAIQLPPEMTKADAKSTAETKLDPSAALQAVAAQHEKASTSHVAAMPAIQQADAPVSPRTVAEENVDRIVTSIHGDIATKGGTMQIRLDPPSLGAINVQISIDDGVMSASLQTNNDEATRLLSHNLAQLKSQLESAGVTVDRIQVKQATPTDQSSNSNSQNDSGDRQQNRDAGQDQSARQEQQRREMLQRMWAKLAGNGDPLDLVA